MGTESDIEVVGEATNGREAIADMDKLHLASRTQAALYALREGLASLYDEKSENNSH